MHLSRVMSSAEELSAFSAELDDFPADQGTRDYDKEIEDYIASDNWLPDIYTASTPVSSHDQIVVDRLWEEVAAEAVSYTHLTLPTKRIV